MGLYADTKNKILYLWDGEINLNKQYEDFEVVELVSPKKSKSDVRIKKSQVGLGETVLNNLSFYIKTSRVVRFKDNKYYFSSIDFIINPR
jgi:hypothetical protein